MQKQIDIDKTILFTLPIVLVITLLLLPDETLFFSISLIVALFIFECMIFNRRELYGFSGLKIPTAPSIIILTFTVFIAIPSIYVCIIKNNPAIYPYFFSILCFYILYPLGLLFSNTFWKINSNRLKSIRLSAFKKSKFDTIYYEILILLFSVALIIFFDYLIRVDTIPLIELFKHPGDYTRLALLREEAFKLLTVTFIEKYLYTWQRSVIIPIGIIASLFLFIMYKRRKYLILFLLFFVLGIIFNSLTLEKSPIAAIFLTLMAFVYLRKKKINLKFIFIAIILVFGLPVLIMAMIYFRHEGLFRLLYISFLYRIFIVPSEVLYYYYEIFPQYHDFLWGRSTQLFSWLHDAGSFPLSNYVAKYWWQNPDTTGFANAMFLGNFWADFGFPGVIISSFIVGIIIHWFYWKLITVSDYYKDIVFITCTSITVPMFTFVFFSSNFTTIFFTRGLIIIVFLFFIIEFLKRNYNYSNYTG